MVDLLTVCNALILINCRSPLHPGPCKGSKNVDQTKKDKPQSIPKQTKSQAKQTSGQDWKNKEENYSDNSLSSSKKAKEFLDKWSYGEKGTDTGGVFQLVKPSDAVVRDLAGSRPDKPITLYRSHRTGANHEEYESWTPHREMAEVMTDSANEEKPNQRVVITRKVHPSEMLVHTDHVSKDAKNHVVDGEVIVANGPAAERIARLRGERLVKGQIGKPKIIKSRMT